MSERRYCTCGFDLCSDPDPRLKDNETEEEAA